MDLSGSNVLEVIRIGSSEEKHAVLQDLKTHVKKDNVQLQWVGKYFEALSLAVKSPDTALQTLAFGLICHLVKRVSIQDSRGAVLSDQSSLVLPILIPRIADARSSAKVSAKRALEAYWLSSPKSVEHAIVDSGLANRSSLLVNECVAWLNYILTSVSPHFKLDTFLDPLAHILREHANDDKLVSNIKVLLENYYDSERNRERKSDLKMALERNHVPATLRLSLMGTDSVISHPSSSLHRSVSISDLPQAQITASVASKPVEKSPSPFSEKRSLQSVESRSTVKSNTSSNLHDADLPKGVSCQSELNELLRKLPNYVFDDSIKPLDVASASEIHSIASEMSQCFENKETERNWSSREKSILKLRSLIRGNALTDFLDDLVIAIKELSEGICKSLSSLRTTLSVNSCQFIKDLAFLLRSNFELLSDIFTPTLIKLCSSTKHLTNTNAHVAMCAVMSHCPLTSKLGHKIWNAASEKSVNTKSYASFWLQIYIMRSHDSWKGSGSEIAEKVLLKLLPDPNMQVRQGAKDAFWKYFEYAEESATSIRPSLDSNIDKALERSRPKGSKKSHSTPVNGAKSRPSLKESILAKKRELKSKQSVSRSVSRHDLIRPSGPASEAFATPDLPRLSSKSSIAEELFQTRSTTNSLSEYGPISSLQAKSSGNAANASASSAHTSSGGRNKKSDWQQASFKNETEPHYALPTLAHPSYTASKSQLNLKDDAESERRLTESFQRRSDAQSPGNLVFQQNGQETQYRDQYRRPNENEDPMIKFLASTDEQILQEGVSLLKNAIFTGETLPQELKVIVRRLSIKNPLMLTSLFNVEDGSLQRAYKYFSKEDFLRMTCIVVEPTVDSFDSVLSLFTAEEIYSSFDMVLSDVREPTDVPDDELLVMQLIKYKERILTMILRMLSHAATKIPMTDVLFDKLTNSLFDLVPVVHQTNLILDFKKLLFELLHMNPILFVSTLSSVKNPSKQEIEFWLDIENQSSSKGPEPSIFELTEFTQISPGKNLEHLSPLKFPPEFTMLLPRGVKVESEVISESGCLGSHDSIEDFEGNKASDEQGSFLEKPPQMKLVPEEDIVMEEIDENDSDMSRRNLDETMALAECKGQDSFQDTASKNKSVAGIKLEPADFNILPKPSTDEKHNDESHELVEDFASVRLSSQVNSIENFIEKVDPLSKLSGKNRPISIYDDSKAGSPQKVKEYDFSELNWFNFLMAKMTLDYGLDDLERYSKQDFRSLCDKLSDGSANEDSIATMLKYLRVPDPETLASFLQNEGYSLVEEAVMRYLSLDHTNLLEGLMIIKQLLVNRYAISATRVWGLLLDLSEFQPDEPLRTLELAVGETFDEMLSGIYSSKELIKIVTQALHTRADLDRGSLRFCLESLHKLLNMEALVLSINSELVSAVDSAIHQHISHSRAEVRKLVIEIYGRVYRASKISHEADSQEMRSSHEPTSFVTMQQIMSTLSTPQQRIIEYFGRK